MNGLGRKWPVMQWPHKILPYTQSEVTTYCVNDPEWQKFRLTLKGVPTVKKLEMLEIRRMSRWAMPGANITIRGTARRYEVQIDNYLNALKRGGQLNMKLEVVK